jgi:hypothetical protein
MRISFDGWVAPGTAQFECAFEREVSCMWILKSDERILCAFYDKNERRFDDAIVGLGLGDQFADGEIEAVSMRISVTIPMEAKYVRFHFGNLDSGLIVLPPEFKMIRRYCR